MPTYAPRDFQTSLDLPFDRLPVDIRYRIYDNILPEAIIFQVTKRGRLSRWPKNPLTDLALCFPQYQNELNVRMYSSTRFIFYDSLYNKNQSIKTYGYEIAAEFFSRIGPANLSYIKQIYCHFHWTKTSATLPNLLNMLSLIASTDPPRDIRKLPLSFTKTSRVKPYKAARVIRRPCFVLHGFAGLEIILIFPNSKDHISVADLNAAITIFYDSGSPVNFLTVLPVELRNEIFQYLVPRVCSISTVWPQNTANMPGWMFVNRQMSAEICSVMYRECQFEFHIPTLFFENPYEDIAPRFSRFLKRVGGGNASQIRSVTICLRIFTSLWDIRERRGIPSIATILQVIIEKCAFQIDTNSVPEVFFSRHPDNYQFRIPTLVGKTLIVKIELLRHSPPYSTITLDSLAISILRESLGLSLVPG